MQEHTRNPETERPGRPEQAGRNTRRALLAAGTTAALGAAGAALARPAEAAAGQPLLLGRSNTAGTASTSLASGSTGTAFSVTASAGHGLVGVAKASSKFGALCRNDATASGNGGGALLGDGKANVGLVGRTTNLNTYGIVALNLAAGSAQVGGALVADGGVNAGVVAFTDPPAGANNPAIFADGGLGSWASWLVGDEVVDGFLFASRSLVGVQEPGNVITYRNVVSGEDALHTMSGRATLDATGAATVVLPSGFLLAAGVSEPDTVVQLTAMGAAMPNLAATITADGFTVSGGVASGSVSWTVTQPRSQTPIAARGAPVGAVAAAGAGRRRTTRPTGSAPHRPDPALRQG